jgi:hypothetical protein
MASPFTRDYTVTVQATTTAEATRDDVVARAPFAGTVAAVTVVPDAAITGVDTNSKTLSVINKGSTGAGTTVAATKAFVSGVNAPAFDETSLTVTTDTTSKTVAEGDVLALSQIKVGSGLASARMLVRISLTRDV